MPTPKVFIGGIAFSPRQADVIHAAQEDLLRKELAAILKMSPKTLDIHLQFIYLFIGVHTYEEFMEWKKKHIKEPKLKSEEELRRKAAKFKQEYEERKKKLEEQLKRKKK